MKLLVVTDIHGNLPALEAVLRDARAQRIDRIISCGDHTGFGPCPREVTQRLLALDAVMLAGNHEERLPQADAPGFAGYNWELLRWTRRQLVGVPMVWPRTLRMGGLLFAHGTPDDPNCLLDSTEVPTLLSALPQGVEWYFSGHNHMPWRVQAAGRQAVNPGSLGMLEDGQGGRAPFAIVETAGTEISVTCCTAAYDVGLTRQAYSTGGAAQAAPEMCRAAMYTMETGTYQACLRFVRLAREMGAARGLTLADPASFQMAGRAWNWGDGMDCEAYWRKAGEETI